MTKKQKSNQPLNSYEFSSYQYTLFFQYELKNIWGTSSEDIYVIEHNGTIFHYNGIEWKEVYKNSEIKLTGVWGSGPNKVYVVGSHGTLLHYNGTDWSAITDPQINNVRFTSIWGRSSNDIYLAGAGINDNVVFQFDGVNLNNITPATSGVKWPEFKDISGNKDTLIVVGINGEVCTYKNLKWDITSPGMSELQDVWMHNDKNEIYVVGGGVIAHHDGNKWSTLFEEEPGIAFMDVHGTSPENISAVGYPGKICHFDGIKWEEITLGNKVILNSVWSSKEGAVFAAGSDKHIIRIYDNKWRKMDIESQSNEFDFNGIFGISENNMMAVGQDRSGDSNGRIFKYDGSGPWKEINTGINLYTFNPEDLWMSNESEVFIIGRYNGLVDDIVIHYDIKGSWNTMTLPESMKRTRLRSVWGKSGSDVYVAGSGGNTFHYDGNNWMSIKADINANLNSIWGQFNHENVIAAGEDGMVLKLNKINKWEKMDTGVKGAYLSGIWCSELTPPVIVGVTSKGNILSYGYKSTPLPDEHSNSNGGCFITTLMY